MKLLDLPLLFERTTGAICRPFHDDLLKYTLLEKKVEKIDKEKRIKEYVTENSKRETFSECRGALEMDSFFKQVKSSNLWNAKEVFFWKVRKPYQTIVYAGFTDGSNPIGNIVAVKIKYMSNDMQLLFKKGGEREIFDESSEESIDCHLEVIVEKIEILDDSSKYVKHLKELSKY